MSVRVWILAVLMCMMVLAGGVLGEEGHDDHANEAGHEAEELQLAWGSAIGAVVIVCVLSLVGMTALPCMNKESWDSVLSAFVAIAAGTMMSDSFLHLIPHAFEDAKHDQMVLLGLTAFFGAFSLMVMERIVQNATGNTGHTHAGHSHNHMATITPSEEQPVKDKEGAEGDDESAETRQVDNATAWVNLTAESVHNLVDGMAIGSAMLVSQVLGWTTTLAVALHEIPQELGDYGVLVRSGYSHRRALLANLASSLTALVGVFISLGVGSSIADFNRYVVAFTAGNFLYVALSILVPIMNSEMSRGGKQFRSYAAFALGVTVIGLLTLIEAEAGEAGHAH